MSKTSDKSDDLMDKPDALLSKYAESHDNRIRQATRTWTTLAVLSIYCISVANSQLGDRTSTAKSKPDDPAPTADSKPDDPAPTAKSKSDGPAPTAKSKPDDLTLMRPLANITLPKNLFAVIAMGLLAALLIHWQEVLSRANHLRQSLVQKRIDTLKKGAKEEWDALVIPSTQAVWGIASSLKRSRYDILQSIALPYFWFLKVLSLSVHVGLPFVTLYVFYFYAKEHCFQATDCLFRFLFHFFALVVALQLIFAIRTEFRYSARAIEEIRKLNASRKKNA